MKKLSAPLIVFALALALCVGCSQTPESDPGEANYAVIKIKDFGEITVELKPEYAPNTVERFVENVRAGFYTGKNFHRVMTDFMIQGGSFDGKGGVNFNVQGVMTETHPDARHYYGAFCLASNAGMGSDSFYIVNNKNPDTVEVSESKMNEYLEHYQLQLAYVLAEEDALIEVYGKEAVDKEINALWGAIEYYTVQIRIIDEIPEAVKAKYAEVGGTPELDGDYTVFGYTVKGFDVIDKISAVQTVDNGRGEKSVPTQEIIIEWIIVKTNI